MPAIQFKPYTYEVTKTVQQRYPFEIVIPEGFEAIGEFRPPKKDEYWLGLSKTSGAIQADYDFGPSDPVIILRKQREYSDTEILNYVIKWLGDSVSACGVYSHQDAPLSKAAIFRTLISSSPRSGDIKKDIIADMRRKGI